MTELQDIDNLIGLLRRVKSLRKSYDKKLEISGNKDHTNSTPKQIQKASADTSWAAMDYDKAKTDFARAYAKSSIKTGTEEKEYNPSPFHKYRH